MAPNHDKISGENILSSIGALHHFNMKNKVVMDQNFNIPKKNLFSCIIGGENQHYKFSTIEATKLCDELISTIKENPKLHLLVITSRRTDNNIKNILNKKLRGLASIWTGEGKNPYFFALKYSSYFVITSDSTSMISESAITGKPIYIYNLPYKRVSKRFEYFHNEFNNLNITRNFKNIKKLYEWNYEPLHETKRIAGIIKKRIIEELI